MKLYGFIVDSENPIQWDINRDAMGKPHNRIDKLYTDKTTRDNDAQQASIKAGGLGVLLFETTGSIQPKQITFARKVFTKEGELIPEPGGN